ncbi:MAG: AAA family ATPase [Chloroflexi bacterium]|nr:AAA family ATPase [Chloroflexota bacterium]
MELYVGGIGAIAAVFVVIFGGRGLIDLVRGYSERRRAPPAEADDSPSLEPPDGVATATAEAVRPRESTGPTPAVPLVEPDPVYRRTFVGRDAELKQLHDAFDEALAGHGSLAMVVGEPGIGKTSLCEQLAGYVSEKGGKTLVGHCYEEGSLSLPYLAFVEAVRSYVLVLEPDDLKAQLGRGADELARIVPEIRERAQVEPSPPGDPEEERYRLLQAASDFLRNAAAAQPLLVVLEDLHDADRGTLDMLTHLARNMSGARLLVVGTYRDVEVNRSHPLASALAELRRVTSFGRVSLRGLTQDEVHRMLETIAGHDVPWRWAEVVHRQTEGNPLFVQEVMRYLVEEGLLARDEGELRRMGDEPLADRIPEGLRDVIGKRMARLSDSCNRVLSVASVVGREFRLDVLELVSDLQGQERLAALKEASGVGVVEERTSLGTGVTFRFTHAFFRQTLYEEIFAPQRLQLHQDVARALEQVHAARPEEHAAEMAEHFAQSTDRGDLAKALAYSEMAAEQAVAVHAYSEAARLLDQAIKVQQVLDPDDKAKRCDLLLALAEALLPTDEPRRVPDVVAPEALALAEDVGDSERASRACRWALEGLHRSAAGTAWTTPEWRDWSKAADRYAGAESVDRVYADIGLGRAIISGGDLDEGFARLRRALDIARRLDDAEALFSAAFVVLRHGMTARYFADMLPLAWEFADRPTAGVRARTLALVREFTSWHLMAAGERTKGEELLRDIEKLGERSGDKFVVVLWLSYVPILLTIDGRLEEAAAAVKRLADAEELGAPELRANFAQNRGANALFLLGRLDEARALSPDAGYTPGLRALGLAAEGRREEAQRALREPEFVPGDLFGFAMRQLEAALVIEDREAAQELAGELEGFADVPLVIGGVLSSAARLLGGAAVLLGNPAEARAYYAQALEACAKIRFRPEIALTRLELAELLLDHYPDERAEAIEHLDFAIAEFREMKMRPSLEKSEALRAAQTN